MLLLHDVLGPRAECLKLGHQISQMNGRHTVYIPVLFGKFGRTGSLLRGNFAWLGARNTLGSLFCGGDDPAQLKSLKMLVGQIRAKHGMRVTVIGNCLTGGLALGLLASPDVNGVIVSQPALPYTAGSKLDVSRNTLSLATLNAGHLARPAVLGFRYRNDKVCRQPRFITLQERFQQTFDGIEFCNASLGESPAAGMRALVTSNSHQHSVLIPEESLAVPPQDHSLERSQVFREIASFLAKRSR